MKQLTITILLICALFAMAKAMRRSPRIDDDVSDDEHHHQRHGHVEHVDSDHEVVFEQDRITKKSAHNDMTTMMASGAPKTTEKPFAISKANPDNANKIYKLDVFNHDSLHMRALIETMIRWMRKQSNVSPSTKISNINVNEIHPIVTSSNEDLKISTKTRMASFKLSGKLCNQLQAASTSMDIMVDSMCSTFPKSFKLCDVITHTFKFFESLIYKLCNDYPDKKMIASDYHHSSIATTPDQRLRCSELKELAISSDEFYDKICKNKLMKKLKICQKTDESRKYWLGLMDSQCSSSLSSNDLDFFRGSDIGDMNIGQLAPPIEADSSECTALHRKQNELSKILLERCYSQYRMDRTNCFEIENAMKRNLQSLVIECDSTCEKIKKYNLDEWEAKHLSCLHNSYDLAECKPTKTLYDRIKHLMFQNCPKTLII